MNNFPVTSDASPVQPPLSADHRLNNFDFLRFLFASLVLFYHSFPLLLGVGQGQAYFGEGFAGLAGGGSVDFFFVISGFLVTASWVRTPSFRPYLTKRVLRIYPGFLLAMLFCAFVAGPLGADSASLYWHHFKIVKACAYLFLLPADVVGPDMALMFTHQPFPRVIDGSCWTLRCEFTMYLLVALLGAAGLYRLRQGRSVLVLFGLLFCVYAGGQISGHPFLPKKPIPWIGGPNEWVRLSTFFLSGMTYYCYRSRIPVSAKLCAAALVALVAASFKPPWFNVLLPVLGSYILFYIAFQPNIKLHNFARYGDFSYGLYLFAFPIQQLLVRYFGAELTPYRLFFAAFPLSLLCAAFSWHFVEKPCLRLKPLLSRKNAKN